MDFVCVCVKIAKASHRANIEADTVTMAMVITVSKIAITFNYPAGCTNRTGFPEGVHSKPPQAAVGCHLIWPPFLPCAYSGLQRSYHRTPPWC